MFDSSGTPGQSAYRVYWSRRLWNRFLSQIPVLHLFFNSGPSTPTMHSVQDWKLNKTHNDNTCYDRPRVCCETCCGPIVILTTLTAGCWTLVWAAGCCFTMQSKANGPLTFQQRVSVSSVHSAARSFILSAACRNILQASDKNPLIKIKINGVVTEVRFKSFQFKIRAWISHTEHHACWRE